MRTLLLAVTLFAQGITLQPAGVLTGRVLNTDGTPAAKLRVSVMPVPDPGTQTGILPGLSNLAETDSSGNFRIEDVVPGRYYVVAGFVEFPTYYPGVRDLAGATIVNVTSSATVSGINFRVASASGGLKVSGRVVGLDVMGYDVRTPVTVSLNGPKSLTATVRADGSFEVARVPPGRYAVRIVLPISNRGSTGASVELVDKDVTGVELSVFRMKNLTGRIAIEGRGAIPRLTFTLTGLPGTGFGVMQVFPNIEQAMPAAQDATFRLSLPEGERRVEPLAGLPPGYAVKSFSYGASDLTRDSLKVNAADSSEVGLVLTAPDRPPVKVSGRLVGLDKEDFAGTIRINMSSSLFVRSLTAVAGEDGSFEFAEVYPGNYIVDVPGLDIPNIRNTPVSVANADIKNVEIMLPGKKEIRGRIVVDGDAPLPRLAMRWSSAPGPNTNATKIDPQPDGTFKVALYAGAHTDTSFTLPQGYTLKSLTYGSVDIRRAPFRVFNADTAELEVRLAVSNLRPVKVSGHAAGATNVSLKSSAYAAALNAAVAPDGSFEFPAVLPGNYALLPAGPGVPPDTCAPVAVADTDRRNVDITVARPGTPTNDVQILSAIYGGNFGSADVTPVVGKWMKPDSSELYAAPKWLEVDPAVSQTKSLMISYLYRCEEYMLSTIEPWPVSYAILEAHANPALRQTPPEPGKGEVTIVASYYGSGNQFRTITPPVRQVLGPGDSFVVDDATLNASASGNASGKQWIFTYSYKGTRNTVVASLNRQFSYEQLVSNAESERLRQHTSDPPPWFKDAEPFPPREPGDPGPGFGQSPRRELAIAALLKAVAELKAIAPEDMTREIGSVTSLAQQALADAQANINYPYPAPLSKPILAPVRVGPRSMRLANASKALKAALEQLASAGGGPNEGFLELSMKEIQQAVAGLQAANAK